MLTFNDGGKKQLGQRVKVYWCLNFFYDNRESSENYIINIV
jgi:hypothetical protein